MHQHSFKTNSLVIFGLCFLALAGQLRADDALTGQTCPEVWDGTEVYLPSKSNCGEYFQCVHGVPILMNCPDDLYWDQSTNTCNWPDQISPPCTGNSAN